MDELSADRESDVYLVGRRNSPHVQDLRDFLSRNRVPFGWVDLDRDPLVRALGARVPDDLRLPAGEERLEALHIDVAGQIEVVDADALFLLIGGTAPWPCSKCTNSSPRSKPAPRTPVRTPPTSPAENGLQSRYGRTTTYARDSVVCSPQPEEHLA